MNKAVGDFSVLDYKHPWHLETISQLRTNAMPRNHARRKSTNPGLQAKQLGESALGKPKITVVPTFGVTYM